MSWKSKGYDELPALSVRGGQLRHSLRIVTIAWMYGVVWQSIITGDQMRSFARMVGCNDFWFGVLSAVPWLAAFGQLNAAMIIERVGLRKYHFMDTAALHRLLWLAVAAIPLVLPIPSGWAVTAVLVVLSISYFLGSFANTAWMTWMGDLIPRRVRGRYFARRAQITQVVQIVAVIICSILLDLANRPDLPEEAACQPALLWTICGLFAAAAIFGTTDILLFHRVREVLPATPDGPHSQARQDDAEPSAAATSPPSGQGVNRRMWKYWRSVFATMWQILADPLKDPVFRNYVCYGAVITFSLVVGSIYFWRYATETLGFSKLGTNALFLVIGPLAGTVAAPWLGRMQDRWGRRPVLIVSTIGTVLSLIPWFFPVPGMRAPAFFEAGVNWVSHGVGWLIGHPGLTWAGQGIPLGAYLLAAGGCTVGGIAWTGVTLAQTGVVLGFADGPGRTKFVAASSVFVSMGGALGGVIGGVVAQSLEYYQAHPLHVGPFIWNNWHAVFLLAIIVRCASMLWLVNMPDPHARPMRDMLKYWKENALDFMTGRLMYPLRMFGWRPGRRDQSKNDNRKQ